MTAGQWYQCSVTVKNTGTKPWTYSYNINADKFGMGALNDANGVAAKFGPIRFYVPSCNDSSSRQLVYV